MDRSFRGRGLPWTILRAVVLWVFGASAASAQLLPVELPPGFPVGTGDCPGVRPGASVLIPNDDGSSSLCSFNFVFDEFDEEEGSSYVGTAAHCVVEGFASDDETVETTWPSGRGPVATDGEGNQVGHFVFAAIGGGRDFALIRLNDDVIADGSMCHFGGPTGTNDDVTGEPTLLHHYGNGVGVSEVVPARTALAPELSDPDQAGALGIALPGDSGSGLIGADGRAVGVIVTVGVSFSIGTDDGARVGEVGITRIAPQVLVAEQALGIDLGVRTAPLE